MRILVFEFITGGGFVKQHLPESLLHEGYLMRDTLLDDLALLPNFELLILQDERIAIDESRQQKNCQYLMVEQGTQLNEQLSAHQDTYDIVWLIAPESDGILAFWCYFFTQQGKLLATSAQQAVEICEDKFRTHTILQNAGIPSVPSRLFNLSTMQNNRLDQIRKTLFHNVKNREAGDAKNIVQPKIQFPDYSDNDWQFPKNILKVNNSVGCDEVYILESELHWQNVIKKLRQNGSYIFQPYISGKVLSLSCLFYQGAAYFICCNEQHMKIDKQQFELMACTVNVQPEMSQIYQKLCQQIADVIPQLFGYVGIDFIQVESGKKLILEINPRLTSSYAGIREALGINVAELVLGMLNHQPPTLIKSNNQQVIVNMNQGNLYAG